MAREIATDEAGKHAIDSDGNDIGVVVDVDDDGTAYVDPSREIGGELETRLGWGSDTASRYPLRNDAIGTITEDGIHLRDEY